jgi:hypothetical protein
MMHRLATLMVGFLATGALLAGAANADPDNSSAKVVRKGAFCSSAGLGTRGVSSAGDNLVCQDDGNGRNRWLPLREGVLCSSASLGDRAVSSAGDNLACQDGGNGQNRWLPEPQEAAN